MRNTPDQLEMNKLLMAIELQADMLVHWEAIAAQYRTENAGLNRQIEVLKGQIETFTDPE